MTSLSLLAPGQQARPGPPFPLAGLFIVRVDTENDGPEAYVCVKKLASANKEISRFRKFDNVKQNGTFAQRGSQTNACYRQV